MPDHVLVSIFRGRDHPKTESALSSAMATFIFASTSEENGRSPLLPSPTARLNELLFEHRNAGFGRLQLPLQESDAVQGLPSV